MLSRFRFFKSNSVELKHVRKRKNLIHKYKENYYVSG